MSKTINRVTGLLIIEAVNSNPNGNPDQESDPRVRDNNIGEISPVSFKRKLRDLLEDREGPVFANVTQGFLPNDLGFDFCILETRGRDRKEIQKEMSDDIKEFKQDVFLKSTFVKKYWDARLFGNTFLEEGGNKGYIKTGVLQLGMGLSLAPVEIQRHTNTNKAGVQEGKNQGMAPLAYRVVQHGVYAMPFFVNPTFASKTGCQAFDLEVFNRLVRYAYDHTRSAIRPDVRIRHAWYMDHKSPLGSCPDYLLIDAMTPKRKGNDPMAPSTSWVDYEVPTSLPKSLADKVDFKDLMA